MENGKQREDFRVSQKIKACAEDESQADTSSRSPDLTVTWSEFTGKRPGEHVAWTSVQHRDLGNRGRSSRGPKARGN